ncbi:hypothetical protein AAC387_Pa05g0456 [Persea americana]
MGQQQSKEELIYQQVNYGNIEGIKVLRREGGGLEWVDKEGKTPLIVACLKPDSLHVAKALIELGANVNYYRPGRHGGTPLHHAAKRGLEHAVKLLLSSGANALVMNDDCHTPLDMAREKRHTSVVRAIESHICLFSGWLRELYGPGFLEALISQWVSRKVWAVVIPRDARNPNKPQKFELAIYSAVEVERKEHLTRRERRRRRRQRLKEKQVAQPRTVIQLWKADIKDVNFNQSDPTLVIMDKASNTRFKFLSENEGDKKQLERFYNACRGMRQPNIPHPTIPATAPTSIPEDVQLAMAINASLQTAMEGQLPNIPTQAGSQVSNTNGWGPPSGPSLPPPKVVDNGWLDEPSSSSTFNGWGGPEAGSSGPPIQHHNSQLSTPVVDVALSSLNIPPSVPSAPPIPDDDGPIHYPSIDSSPIDLSMPTVDMKPASSVAVESSDTSASCVICLDAPKQGACVPCGHVVGCMNCLNDIKAKNWGCPVCRAKINQVIKLYTV